MMNLPTPAQPLRIGTRGSPLALAQAHEVRARLMAAHGVGEAAFEVVVIKVTGDLIQDRSLREAGGKGLFTREIEEALLAGRIDLAVHSSKDMPTLQPEGLCLPVFLPREDPRDGFVSLCGEGLDDLPEGAKVGSSSLRRKAQLLRLRPDLEVVEFRGNVQTRMSKLEEGVARATLLAMAGVRRLAGAGAAVQGAPVVPIAENVMLPAIAQGAIGVEIRQDDTRVAALLAPISCPDTTLCVQAERAFLAQLDGSCQTPIAGLARLDGERLHLRGEVLSPDGRECVQVEGHSAPSDGIALGRELAQQLQTQAKGTTLLDWHNG